MKYLCLKEKWRDKLLVVQNPTSNDTRILLPEVSDDIQIVMDTTEYIFGYAGCVRIGRDKSLLHYAYNEDFDKVFEECKKFIETYYEQVEIDKIVDKIQFPDTNQWYVLEKPMKVKKGE